jgi:hypothetical protein
MVFGEEYPMRHFFFTSAMAWFAMTCLLALIEWRVPGFVSVHFPFYLLFVPTIVAIAASLR